MNRFSRPSTAVDRGFTLVELLVVIGIIALLIGLLLPSLRRARLQSQAVACASNMRQVGMELQFYLNDNKGWLFPVGPPAVPGGIPTTFGTTYPPHERWPARVFKLLPVNPLPYNPATYIDSGGRDTWPVLMATFPAKDFTPKIMLCPSDLEPYEAHSYVLNKHLADREIRSGSGSRKTGGKTSSDVVVMGEKRTTERDYYMERGEGVASEGPLGVTYSSDFERLVEPYRHGISRGSNYLFLDWHVSNLSRKEALNGMDPWDVASVAATP